MRLLKAIVLLTCATCWPLLTSTQGTAASLADGSGKFEFIDAKGNADRPITVWYYRPKSFERNRPILFVIHGRDRNGSEYRDAWIEQAERDGYLLLCPEFSHKHYPDHHKFNLGYMFDDDDRPRNKEQWSFMAIEHLFDRVVESNSLDAKRYTIYGHSAGGQFVHRMAIFLPEARFSVAIAANPGWYTMPSTSVNFPYGLKGTGTSEEHLRRVLERRLVLLLGTSDQIPNDENLLTTDEANAQGPHRFARGQTFFRAGEDAARQLNADFKWSLIEVPGVGHDNAKMAPAASKLVK